VDAADGEGAGAGRLQVPVLRGFLDVLACSGIFTVLAAVLTVAGAVQRRRVWEEWVPRLFADAHASATARGLTMAPDSLQDWLGWVPSPIDAAADVASHVLTQGLLFATLCVAIQTLAAAGRPVAATVGALGAAVGATVSAGPFGVLPGTLAHDSTDHAFGALRAIVLFEAPVWWRALASVIVAVPLIASVVLVSRRGRRSGPRGVTAIVAAGFLLLVPGVLVAWPEALIQDGDDPDRALATAAVLLTLAWAGAGAGSVRQGLRGLGAATLLTAVAGAAWLNSWNLYHREGGAPSAFGWDGGVESPWYGTRLCVLLAVLSPFLGWIIVTAAASCRTVLRRQVRGPALTREVVSVWRRGPRAAA
jgi:hypothetical protein